MVRIVIFGTGASGRRAWHAADDVDEVEVVAFADNDTCRHGTKFFERPVWSADDLARAKEWDFVVIASQWHAEISEDLMRRGLSADRLMAFEPVRGPGKLSALVEAAIAHRPVEAGDRVIAPTELPRVLLLTFETLNQSHGTGVLVLRYFARFPRSHLLSVAHRDAGPPALPNAIQMRSDVREGRSQLVGALRASGFEPDLIYATALHEADLDVIEACLSCFPGVSVIQHFMDYAPHADTTFEARLRKLWPRFKEVWALTEPMRRMLEATFGSPVALVTALQQRVPEQWKESARGFDAGFRTVAVGNFYHPGAVEFSRLLWERCRSALPGLGPVEWHVHPQRAQDLLDAGFDPGLDFVWRGFFVGGRLQRALRSADLGLLILNPEASAGTGYLRYSLPSRLTEFACAGLPIFAVASSDTPLAQFVTKHGVGRVASGPDVDGVATALREFILDRPAREAAGRAARALAETTFALGPFRRWFYGKLCELARSGAASATKAGP